MCRKEKFQIKLEIVCIKKSLCLRICAVVSLFLLCTCRGTIPPAARVSFRSVFGVAQAGEDVGGHV